MCEPNVTNGNKNGHLRPLLLLNVCYYMIQNNSVLSWNKDVNGQEMHNSIRGHIRLIFLPNVNGLGRFQISLLLCLSIFLIMLLVIRIIMYSATGPQSGLSDDNLIIYVNGPHLEPVSIP